MPEIQSRLNPVVFLKGLRAAGNRFITPRKLMDISRSVFGKELTPEQARDRLTEVEADLRPLYSASLWLLARGNIREGSIQEVLPFCRRRHAYWKVSDSEDDKYARENYLRALVCRFPEKSFVDDGMENPWREIEDFSDLFCLDPNMSLSVTDLPESKEDLLAFYESQLKGDNLTAVKTLKIFTRYAGLTDIPANIIARMQRDFLFAFALHGKAQNIGLASFNQKAVEREVPGFLILLSNPKMEYSFKEAQEGLGSPLNNFGLNYLSLYRRYKTNMEAYEDRLKAELDNIRKYAEEDTENRTEYERLSQIYREICLHMDEIVRINGLDFEVDKLPEVFFYQGYRGGIGSDGEWGDAGREDHYKHQLRNLLLITGILIKRYGYSLVELRK